MAQEEQQAEPWTECIAHPMAYDSDCAYCAQELSEKQKVLDDMRETMMKKESQFMNMTGQSFMASTLAQSVRHDVFIQMFIQDPRHRMAYEMNVANALSHHIDQAASIIRKQQILQPQTMPFR